MDAFVGMLRSERERKRQLKQRERDLKRLEVIARTLLHSNVVPLPEDEATRLICEAGLILCRGHNALAQVMGYKHSAGSDTEPETTADPNFSTAENCNAW